MNEAADHELPHLSPAANRLGAVFARPKLLAVVCVVVLAGLGWLYLALLIAGMGGPSAAADPARPCRGRAPRWGRPCRRSAARDRASPGRRARPRTQPPAASAARTPRPAGWRRATDGAVRGRRPRSWFPA